MMDRDNTTRTEAKDPWGEGQGPLAQRPVEARGDLDAVPGRTPGAEMGEGSRQTDGRAGYAGSRLNRQGSGAGTI